MFIGREDQSIIAEVAEKARRFRRNHDVSVRTALVYDGTLDHIVEADGYFDAIVPIEPILGPSSK